MKSSSENQYNNAWACGAAEIIANGKRICWKYWCTRTAITPGQAARLSLCIDPIRWSQNKYAQGPIPEQTMQEITARKERLAECSDKWTLATLVQTLGDVAPFRMKQAVKKAQQPAEATQTARAESKGLSEANAHQWIANAQAIAITYIDRHKEQDLFPTQNDVCVHVAKELRINKIYGAHGTPLEPNYIKRNAIGGKWWQANKP